MRMDLLSAVLVVVPTAALAGGARPITMDEALRRAEELSPAGQEIALGIERARAEIEASGLWSNPEFSLVREESAGVVERFANVSQTFPLTGRLAIDRDAARTGHAAAQTIRLTRSSHRPWATFAMMLLVAGATSIRSARSVSPMC